MNRTLARATLLASSTIVLALGACSSTQECSDSSCSDGKMTITQAEEMYGAPSKVRYSPNGSETWTWDSMNKSMTFMDGVLVK